MVRSRPRRKEQLWNFLPELIAERCKIVRINKYHSHIIAKCITYDKAFIIHSYSACTNGIAQQANFRVVIRQ